jgi:hypothetical protein
VKAGMKFPENGLPLGAAQVVLVRKATDTFIDLISAVWKLDVEGRKKLEALRPELFDHFASALDESTDNPADFYSPLGGILQ